MLFVVLLVIAGFIVTGVLPVGEYLERGTKVAVAQEELDSLVAENGALANDIEALFSEQEVERSAREQYGFVRRGEVDKIKVADMKAWLRNHRGGIVLAPRQAGENDPDLKPLADISGINYSNGSVVQLRLYELAR